MSLRLALRLVRGGGAAGLWRLLLMVSGIAVAVAAATLVAVLPTVLAEREAVVAGRLPALADDEGSARFQFSQVDDVWHGERLGRTFIAEVTPGTRGPSGVDRLPGPGEIVASPALARLLAADDPVSSLVPGRVVATIDEAGLLGPDELYAFVGIPADRLEDFRRAVGFGSNDRYGLEGQQAGLPQALAMLVLPPVVVYLLVCARLAAATRNRRYAALRLVGLRRGTLLRVAAAESALAGALGAVAGVALLHLSMPAVARSGMLGFAWYPAMAGITVPLLVAVVLTVVLAAGAVGAAGLRRSLDQALTARSDDAEPAPRWWLVIPLLVGLVLLGGALLLGSTAPEESRLTLGARAGWLVVAGIGLVTVGSLLGLRPLVAAVARLLARDGARYPVRLAGRRLVHEPAGTLRLLGGLGLMVLVAGIGSGVLHDLALRSGPRATHFQVQIDGTQLGDAATAEKIFGLAERRWTVQRSITTFIEPGAPIPTTPAEQVSVLGMELITMDCANLRAVAGTAVPQCQPDKLYRLASPELVAAGLDLPPGTAVRFRTANGGEKAVTAPQERLVLPGDGVLPIGGSGSLVLTRSGPAHGWSSDVWLGGLVPGEPSALEQFKAAVADVSPATRIQVTGENLEMLETYRNQSGVLTTGIRLGFALGALAFLIAYLDRVLERRRDIASLMVLGVRRRTIRLIQVLQLLAPLAATLILALAVGHLAGNAALRLNHVGLPWYSGTLAAMVPLIVMALLAAVGAGSVVALRTLRSDDLRRE